MLARDRVRSRNARRDDSPSVWRHVVVGVGVCTLATLATFALWHVTRLPALTVSEIQVVGGDTIATGSVQEEVESILRGSYFKIIPYTFSLTYPHDRIASVITGMPRVKDVTIERDTRKLTVAFTEYVPYALWCLTASHDCYFLDETGYAFAPGPRLDGGALVRHIFEEDTPLEKKQVFDSTSFSMMHAFLARLQESRSLRVTDVLYTKDGDIRIMVNGGGELILKNGESYDVLFANLTSILMSEEFKHLEPGNFKYIDLRFGNKIFVNEKLDPIIVATTTPSTTSERLPE